MSAPETLDEELAFTQGIRKKIIADLTKGKSMDQLDSSVVSQLQHALDAHDRVTLTKMKIKSDEGISDKAQLAAQALGALYMDKRTREIGAVIDVEARTTRGQPALPASLPEIVPLEGEMGPTSMENFDAFAARTGFGEFKHNSEAETSAL